MAHISANNVSVSAFTKQITLTVGSAAQYCNAYGAYVNTKWEVTL